MDWSVALVWAAASLVILAAGTFVWALPVRRDGSRTLVRVVPTNGGALRRVVESRW